MEENLDLLTWLQKWYGSHCNGDWEHGNGIKIGNIDNPGWTLEINIEDTGLEHQKIEYLGTHRTKDDWLHFKVEGNTFKGACGPFNLTELIYEFRVFAEGYRLVNKYEPFEKTD